MPLPIPNAKTWTPVRRQILEVRFAIAPDEGATPSAPVLTGFARLSDLYRASDGSVEWDSVPAQVAVTHAELLACHPSAPEVLGALAALFYAKSLDQVPQ